MKKLFAILTSILLLCAMIPLGAIPVAAATSGTTGDCQWRLDGTKLTIWGNGAMEDFFYYSTLPWGTDITSVTIKDGVTIIGERAFSDCTSLTSVTIGNSVNSIGELAFEHCSSLSSITIGHNVTFIKDEAFYACDSLTTVTIPNSVTSIGNSAFCSCDSLTTVTIPDSVTSIGGSAFAWCKSLTSVTIGDNVSTIGTAMFYQCPSLESVTIGDSVTTIGEHMFDGCSSLTSVVIPNSVITIGKSAFNNCKVLTSVTIPDSVTSIGNSAFNNCNTLASVTIPNSVTSIGGRSFAGCYSLISMTIPDSVNSIDYQTFYGCNSLTSVTIPDSVTSIGDNAFSGCYRLPSVTLPDSVTIIKDSAFYKCTALSDVYYKGTVEQFRNISIGSDNNDLVTATWHFLDGSSYRQGVTGDCTWVLIDDKHLTIFGNGAMGKYTQKRINGTWRTSAPWGWQITSVTFEEGVTSIGDNAFYGCASLSMLTISDSITTIGETAFSNCDSLVSVIIPDGVNSIGYQAFYECDSLETAIIGNNVTSIGVGAFERCDSLTSVIIGNHVTSIDQYAFRDCSSLKTVTISDSVTSIRQNAFENCNALESVTIGNSITSINESAFHQCTSLSDVYYKGTIEQLKNISIDSNNNNLIDAVWHFPDDSFCRQGTTGDCAWMLINDEHLIIYGNGRMEDYTGAFIDGMWRSSTPWGWQISSVTIEEGVTTIGKQAFQGCTLLSTATIPDSVISLGASAFMDCHLLVSVNIPDSVTTIGNQAFFDCYSLPSVVIGDSVTTIGDGAFERCYALTTSTLGDSVTTIGEYAFRDCASLISVTIPNSITAIRYGAFFGCDYLMDVHYDGTETDRDNLAISAYNRELWSATWHYAACSHTYVDTITAPTCNTDGYTVYTCSVCGDSYTEIIPAVGHSYDSVVTTPDCENSGYTIHTCTVCGDSYVDSRVDALGHNYAVTEHVAPTCAVAGKKVYVCDTCGDCYTESLPATGYHTYEHDCDEVCNICGYVRKDAHNYISQGSVEPTCGEDGYEYYKCWGMFCGNPYIYIVIPATGDHTYSGACDTICNVCNQIRESVAAHTYVLTESVAVTCTTDGKQVYTCRDCGDSYTNTITAQGHTYRIVVTAPTCEQGGYTTHTCTACGDQQVDNRTPALGHVYDDEYDANCNLCGEIREVPDKPIEYAGAIEVSTVEGAAGETVKITVSLSNNPGIISAKVKVFFDASVLKFVGYEIGNFSAGGYSFSDDTITNEMGYFIINWCNAIAGNSTADLLATLTFEIVEGAAEGFTAIAMEYSCEDDMFNADDETVYFEAVNGGVQIVTKADVLPGDVDGNGKINNRDLGLLQRFVNAYPDKVDEVAADLDGNGKINNRDLGLLQQLVNSQ